MRPIILTIILSMVFLFQADGADVRLKSAPSKRVTSPVIKKRPQGAVMPASPAKPDLVIQTFNVTPATVPNGDFCSYQMVVRNSGGPSAVSKMLVGFNINPQLGKNEYLDVPGPGQSLTFSGTLGVPVDRCLAVSYTVTLDAHNQVDESNENNNTATHSIGVQNRPDVGFCNTPSICKEKFINGGVNDKVFIGLDVYNYGCAISPACSMDLNFPEQWPLTVQIPPISPGKFFPYYTYMTWTTPGVKMGEIIIRNAVNDAQNFNDRVKFKVNIVQ